jgi:hypothetical protein
MLHLHALDRHIVHRDHHGSRVRIVAGADVDEAVAELRMLFPHESVLTTVIGCCHRCVYTADAPASLVAERISDHLRETASLGDRDPAPRHPGAAGERSSSDEPLPDFFGPERHGR